jgi:hypothetical protein
MDSYGLNSHTMANAINIAWDIQSGAFAYQLLYLVLTLQLHRYWMMQCMFQFSWYDIQHHATYAWTRPQLGHWIHPSPLHLAQHLQKLELRSLIHYYIMQYHVYSDQQVVLQIWMSNALMDDQKHCLPSLWDNISQRSRNNPQWLCLSSRIITTHGNFAVKSMEH